MVTSQMFPKHELSGNVVGQQPLYWQHSRIHRNLQFLFRQGGKIITGSHPGLLLPVQTCKSGCIGQSTEELDTSSGEFPLEVAEKAVSFQLTANRTYSWELRNRHPCWRLGGNQLQGPLLTFWAMVTDLSSSKSAASSRLEAFLKSMSN